MHSTFPDTGTASGASRFFAALSPRRLNALYLGIFFVIVFSILNPSTYLSMATLNVITSSGAVTAMLALAFLIPLAGNSFDLSIGAMLTFSLTLVSQLHILTDLPLVLIQLITLVACAAVGWVSGLIIVKFHVNSLIATLGVGQLLLAGTLLISNNQQLVGGFPEWWTALGNGTFLGIPIPLYVLVVVGIVIWYVIEHTPAGRKLFAVGGNPEAARLSGINTGRVIWSSMVASAVIAGMAGLLYSARVGVATPSVGDGLLFPAIVAVFLGSSQLSMRPNVWGTLIAFFALEAGIQGLRLSAGAAATWAAPLFQGVALIIAVSIASRPLVKKIRQRAMEKKAGLAPPTGGQAADARGESASDRIAQEAGVE